MTAETIPLETQRTSLYPMLELETITIRTDDQIEQTNLPKVGTGVDLDESFNTFLKSHLAEHSNLIPDDAREKNNNGNEFGSGGKSSLAAGPEFTGCNALNKSLIKAANDRPLEKSVSERTKKISFGGVHINEYAVMHYEDYRNKFCPPIHLRLQHLNTYAMRVDEFERIRSRKNERISLQRPIILAKRRWKVPKARRGIQV